jgi:hypothetical protein
MTDPWHEEGFGAENDWGEESLEADVEGDLLQPAEPDEDEPWDEDPDEAYE